VIATVGTYKFYIDQLWPLVTLPMEKMYEETGWMPASQSKAINDVNLDGLTRFVGAVAEAMPVLGLSPAAQQQAATLITEIGK
jgi:hypothetical protein